MRYREDAPPGVPVHNVTDDFLIITVVFTFFVGILMVVAGRYGRQLWLTFWGWLSILVCGGYIVAFFIGYI